MSKNKKKKKQIKRAADTTNKTNDLAAILFVALIIAIIVMVIALCNPKKADAPEFSPPPFDENAIIGKPSVPEENGYNLISSDQMPYSAYICGKIYMYGSKADVYFTNPETNEVWMKLRVFDSQGNIIGETGLIKPGEYIKDIVLDPAPQSTDTITLKIMTYAPNTYYSEGSFSLTPIVINVNN